MGGVTAGASTVRVKTWVATGADAVGGGEADREGAAVTRLWRPVQGGRRPAGVAQRDAGGECGRGATAEGAVADRADAGCPRRRDVEHARRAGREGGVIAAGDGGRRGGAAARVGVLVGGRHCAGARRRRDGDVHGAGVDRRRDRGRDLVRAVAHGADAGDRPEVDDRLRSPAGQVGAVDRHAARWDLRPRRRGHRRDGRGAGRGVGELVDLRGPRRARRAGRSSTP